MYCAVCETVSSLEGGFYSFLSTRDVKHANKFSFLTSTLRKAIKNILRLYIFSKQ